MPKLQGLYLHIQAHMLTVYPINNLAVTSFWWVLMTRFFVLILLQLTVHISSRFSLHVTIDSQTFLFLFLQALDIVTDACKIKQK